jgi:glutaredoxin
VTLVSRVGCHLCDDARSALSALGVAFDEVDVDAEPQLRERYDELVPVFLLDGRQLGYGRLDPDRLARGLRRPPGRWRPW